MVCLFFGLPAGFTVFANGLSTRAELNESGGWPWPCLPHFRFFALLRGNISLLLVGRSIQGAAGAVIIPGAMSIIFHAFDDAKLRAKVVGGWSTFSAIGLIVGPLLGGFLVDHTGWPSIFLINIPLGIMALALGGWGMKQIPVEKEVSLMCLGRC